MFQRYHFRSCGTSMSIFSQMELKATLLMPFHNHALGLMKRRRSCTLSHSDPDA
jgi:hypothetical protein